MFHYLAVVNPPQSGNPLVPSWTEVIWGGLAFLIIFVALWKILLPRITLVLQDRTEKIEGGLQQAEELQAEAKRTLEQYQAQLADARHEAARLREAATEQGAQIIAEMREQAQAEARRITEAARTQIAADRQQAFATLREEIGTLSVQLASKIVGESLEDDARQSRVVDRFLAELDASQSQASGARATS
jgi:F-type H+-transporting ATPase subunit b